MHRVAICTFSRAEYGLMKQVIRHASARFDTYLVAGGWHHSALHGSSFDEILSDALLSHGKLLQVPFGDPSSSFFSMTESVAKGITAMNKLLSDHHFDALVVMGDRHELFAATLTALHHRIPVVHMSGGEVTGGAIDDLVRHSTTKLSHLHLVANSTYAENVSRMGEEDWRIVVTGEPGIDNIYMGEFATKEELIDRFGIDNSMPLILVTLHPSTLETDVLLRDQYMPLANALAMLNKYRVIITAPGGEEGTEEIIRAWIELAQRHPHIQYIPHLGSRNYLGLMRIASAVAGNSSSALTEASLFGVPAVNVGNRQKGRMAAPNILHCGYETQEILDAINRTSSPAHLERCALGENPYDPYRDGRNSLRVTDAIARFLERGYSGMIQKKFNTDIHREQWNSLLQ
jgi:UDP-hydrolysing UDP-N-acetyl-D-glucosamine 2-epimerase